CRRSSRSRAQPHRVAGRTNRRAPGRSLARRRKRKAEEMSVLLRKAWADVTQRPGRALLMVLALTVAVAGMTAVAEAGEQLSGAFFYSTDAQAVPNIILQVDGSPLPAAVVSQLRQAPGLRAWEQRTLYSAPWQVGGRPADHPLQVFAAADAEPMI